MTCLARADIEHLLACVDRSTALGRRDVALLQFMYNTGARAQEVVDLRLPAVRFGPPPQVRLFGKGRKERLCPLWPETTDLLRAALKDRNVRLTENVPLFVNAAGRPLTRFGLGHIVRERAARAAASRPTLSKTRILLTLSGIPLLCTFFNPALNSMSCGAGSGTPVLKQRTATLKSTFR